MATAAHGMNLLGGEGKLIAARFFPRKVIGRENTLRDGEQLVIAHENKLGVGFHLNIDIAAA